MSSDFSHTAPPSPSNSRTWSSQQTAVFDWFERGRGHLVVRARAGTGKTTTIMEGVSRAQERQILLAAFNKEIAKELQSRVRSSRVEVKTLHALGFKYVRRNWRVEVEDTDRADSRAMRLAREAAHDAPEEVHSLIAKLHTKTRELAPRATVEDVEDVACRFDMQPSEDMESSGWSLEAICRASMLAMKLATEQTSVIDYADMIFLPIVKRWIRPWFDMVVVDEAQDMTESQLELAMGACRRGGRICVVGDDRQAIYGFRGADSGSIDRLKSTLDARELGLTVTYRCPSKIVQLAAEIVPDFTAAPGATDGEVANCDEDTMIDGAQEGDFVISRKNAPLVRVCMALLRRGVRARVRGRDVGRGIVTLVRKLGARSVADVEARVELHVQRETAKVQRNRRLSEEAKAQRIEYLGDQADVILSLCDGATTVSEIEARVVELFSDDSSRGAVICGTVHKMKGLEADLAWLLRGTFRSGTLEEDNIRYVAITRARTRLTWVG